MQRIAVIGGTGMTGQCVVDHALKKGLKVRLLYRSESTIPERFKDKVDLVKGNVLNLDDCKNVIDGVDAVCVILGTRDNWEATTEMSRGTQVLITAMKQKNIRRFSIIISAYVFYPPHEVPEIYVKINEDHKRMMDLTKASGLEYVAILPPIITDEPSTDYVVQHDDAPGRIISKYDLAKFVVDSLEQEKHIGKACGLSKRVVQ